VAEQENADSLSSHPRNQSPFDGFLRHQTYGPTGATFGRVAAHHGDDPLFLTVVEHGRRAGPLLLVKRRFQATFLVAMADSVSPFRSGSLVLEDLP